MTIAGEPFVHRLYYFILACSGWEYAGVVLGGESFAASGDGGVCRRASLGAGTGAARSLIRLIAPHHVKPFIKRQKNDAAERGGDRRGRAKINQRLG